MTISVRDFQVEDSLAWKRLWSCYLDFYQVCVPDDVTQYTMDRMLDPQSSVFGCVAEENGQLIGFVIYLLHPSTWSKMPVCYLEDLFVDSSRRRTGAGKKLIDEVIARGRHQGWSGVYWHTQSNNQTARRLYDRFTAADDYVRYRIALES